MTYVLLQGTYRLVHPDSNGNPVGFIPDGDSIDFQPQAQDLPLLSQLPPGNISPNLSNINSVSLRLDGIDALEILYHTAPNNPFTHQPRPLADDARDGLTGLLGMHPSYVQPDGVVVQPPAVPDAVPGYILARRLERFGRPVCFAFAGTPPTGPIQVTPDLVRQSLNYQQAQAGNAYPYYHSDLDQDLRDTITEAVNVARAAVLGIWPHDVSTTGLAVQNQADLESNGFVYPTLFRRLTRFFEVTTGVLSDFPNWGPLIGERIINPQTGAIERLAQIVAVQNGQVRLTRALDQIIFQG